MTLWIKIFLKGVGALWASAGKLDRLNCGQHGGLARYEQSPFLMMQGSGFAAGASRDMPTSAVDIAPTVLTHVGVAFDGLDGRALQTPDAQRSN